MLNLFLVRHAKSSWKDTSLDDFHRPLNKRGRRAVPLIAKWMKVNGIKPDLVLISSSQRTKETWKLLNRGGVKAKSTEKHQNLYHASSGELYNAINNVDVYVRSLMIIGHNPGLQILLETLIGSQEPGIHCVDTIKFKTGAVAHLHFHLDEWSEVAPLSGRLYRYVSPKSLEAKG